MNADILYDVLPYIKSPEDLYRITRVCRLWYYVVINTTTWEAVSVLANNNQLHKSKRKQLWFACQYGHLKIIQWLYSACELTVDDIRVDNNWALRCACIHGNLHVVQYLCETFELTVEDIRSRNNWALQLACKYGHLHVFQYLCETFDLTVEDVWSDYNLALRYAYERGHLNVVQYLCQRFHLDYEHENSMALLVRSSC